MGQTVIPWTVLIPVLVALAGCAWFLIAEREVAGQWGYPLDDSWIYATYAKNLASGRGYAFNPGEHVAGATGPLYVFVLAILYYLFRDVLLPAKVLGILCLVASSLVIFQAMRRIDPKSAVTPVLAAALLALSPTLLWGTLSGLEIPLYLLVICMGIYFYVTERWTLAVLAWCVGVWFRPDGMVLALIGLFVRPRLSLKGLIAPCAVAGLIIGAYLAFNQVVGGWILPSSVEVNAHPGQDILPNLRGMAGQWSDLWLGSVGVRRVGVHSPLLLPAMVVGAWAIVRRWPALVAYFVLFPIAFALFTGFGGQFGRYLAPTIPFGTCLAAIGLGTVARRVPRGRSRVGMVAVLAICLVWQGYFARKVGIAYGWNVQNINGMQRFIAEKTRAATSPGDTVAVNDVGAMGYFSGCYIVDLVGLVSERRAFPDYLALYKPKYLIVFPDWFEKFAAIDPQTDQVVFYDADSTYKYSPFLGVRLRRNTISARNTMYLYERMGRNEVGVGHVQLVVH